MFCLESSELIKEQAMESHTELNPDGTKDIKITNEQICRKSH
jgi:hypothetical protein